MSPRSMDYRDDSELLYSKVPNFNHFSVVAMLDPPLSLYLLDIFLWVN